MIEENKSPSELSSIGEFGLIEHLTQHIELKNKSSLLGIGDDAAVIDVSEKKKVVSTDMLVEGVHFDLLYMPLKHLGYKAAIVNFSDIYAMNAHPQQITVSIAVSNRMSIEALEEIYEGIQLACDNYGVDLIGGDTTSSLSGLIISITALGEVDQKRVSKRSGAKENDLICISGDLGAAYVGLQILEREKAIFNENQNIQPDLSGKDYVLERQLKPEARKDIVEWLEKEQIVPSSMIDISDGLSSELLHISKASSCGTLIYEDKLPIDTATISSAEELNINPSVVAMNGGEDYELLFTVPLEQHKKVEKQQGITIIGHITDASSGNNMVMRGSEELSEIKAQGWKHLDN